MRPIVMTLLPLLLSVLAVQGGEYTSGVFVVNEEWYTHSNSSVNFIDPDAPDASCWTYKVIRQENPGCQLGCLNRYGCIYGGRFYFIAKQERDMGATVSGARITVADARTMKILKQLTYIEPLADNCQGRACAGIDEHKIYVSTNNGVWILDADRLEITGKVDCGDYDGVCGTMVRVDEYVYIASQMHGLLIVDPFTDRVVDRIDPAEIVPEDKAGIGSVTLASDGSLWFNVVRASAGTKTIYPYIVRVDPGTREAEAIRLPDTVSPPSFTWNPWDPVGICASTVNNVLYWQNGYEVYRYDIDSGSFSRIIDYAHEGTGDWHIYASAIGVHPVTDEIYTSLFKIYQDPTYRLQRRGSDGALLREYKMISNIWASAMPVFPDVAKPEVHSLGVQSISAVRPTEISLAGIVTDADNMEAAIVKSVESVSDPTAIEATVKAGTLVVTPIDVAAGGSYSVRLKLNSNGEVVYTDIELKEGLSSIDETGYACGSSVYESGSIVVSGLDGRELVISDLLGRCLARAVVVGDRFTMPLDGYRGICVARCGDITSKIKI